MGDETTGPRAGTRVGLFEFLRDVLIASLDKGQFPGALICCIFLSLIWRLRPVDIVLLAGKLIHAAQNTCFIGYSFAIFSLVACFLHVRWQRRWIVENIQRAEGKS